MIKYLLFFVLLVNSYRLYSQDFTSSNLPIVLITTDIDPATSKNKEIGNSTKVLSTMKIIFRPDNSRNNLTDQDNAAFLNYSGRIGIETRGSSSQLLPKKSYGLTTLKEDNTSNNNVKILGMPKENDWILNSLPYDASLIRDFLSYSLSRDMGRYASRGVYCEVVINGDYKGLYIMMEKLKLDAERIDLEEMTQTDTSGSGVTGGYIVKADKNENGETVDWTAASYTGTDVKYFYENPKSKINAQQKTYIKKVFSDFQSKMTAKNASVTDGYPTIIDIPAFVDFMILNELSSNVDAYQFSTFFHKDKKGKLRAGPIWDCNFTFGNDAYWWSLDRSKTDVWQFDNGDNTGSKFWKDLYADTTFRCYLSKRWKALVAPNQPLNYAVISSKIDQLIPSLMEAIGREEVRWNTIGNHVEKITSLKAWMEERITWLNEQLSNSEACSNPVLPALVISKIHYNPVPSQGVESKHLEFIEITNNSNVAVNLSGIYFRELGLSFQFEANQTIGANQKIYLAGNALYFEQVYGFKPFGQFTRTLSDNSFNLVLADAFGNVIDQVQYNDTLPWPVEADGMGPHLSLADVNKDNNIGSNWVASTTLQGVEEEEAGNGIFIFPNPTQRSITIGNKQSSIQSYEITDVMGVSLLKENNLYSEQVTIDLSHLQANTYILQVVTKQGGTVVRKIIKF